MFAALHCHEGPAAKPCWNVQVSQSLAMALNVDCPPDFWHAQVNGLYGYRGLAANDQRWLLIGLQQCCTRAHVNISLGMRLDVWQSSGYTMRCLAQ